jgi:hypothetical protein
MTQLRDTFEQDSQTAWTDIVHLTPESQGVNVRFKVFKKEASRRVTSKSSGRQYDIVDCIVVDSTARINLILWNEDIDLVEKNNSYCLLNGLITVYDECMSLSKGRNGVIKISNTSFEQKEEVVDMSRPFMWKSKKHKSRPTTGRTLNGTSGREVRRYSSRKSF